MGFLERLKDGLSKTRRNFTDRIEELVGMSAKVDEDFLEELEMILLSGDVGVKTTEKLIDAVRQAAKKKEIEGTEQVMPFLKNILPKCCRTKDSVPVSVPNLRLFLSWASMVLVKPLLSASWPTISSVQIQSHAGCRRYLPCRRCRTAADLGGACRLRSYPSRRRR